MIKALVWNLVYKRKCSNKCSKVKVPQTFPVNAEIQTQTTKPELVLTNTSGEHLVNFPDNYLSNEKLQTQTAKPEASSVDFESLIGSHLMMTIGSSETTVPVAYSHNSIVDNIVDKNETCVAPLPPTELKVVENIPDLSTTPHVTVENETLASTVTPPKSDCFDEATGTTIRKPDICSDHDHDARLETPKNSTDNSDGDNSGENTLKSINFLECDRCHFLFHYSGTHNFNNHINYCYPPGCMLRCAHCQYETKIKYNLYLHYQIHAKTMKENAMKSADKRDVPETAFQISSGRVYVCGVCNYTHAVLHHINKHLANKHNVKKSIITSAKTIVEYTVSGSPTATTTAKRSSGGSLNSPIKRIRYSSQNLDQLPEEPILDDWTYCAKCDFKTKVRLDLVQHMKQHAEKTQKKKRKTEKKNTKKTKNQKDVSPRPTDKIEKEGSLNMGPLPSLEPICDLPINICEVTEGLDLERSIPQWQILNQNTSHTEITEIQTDIKIETDATPASVPLPTVVPIDLNKIKSEFLDSEIEDTVEELCDRFGKFCEPYKIHYRCPYCSVVLENSKDAKMHLFEELKYTKWGCGICEYKSIYQRGLEEHILQEHGSNGAVKSLKDGRIEKWIDNLLEHQSIIIEKNRNQIFNVSLPKPTPAPPMPQKWYAVVVVNDERIKTLEQAFGKMGSPQGMNFCCPKCEYRSKDEVAFKHHLEIELNKIRWRCNNCSTSFENQYEALFHISSCRSGPGPAYPVDMRHSDLRGSWLDTAIYLQKQAMRTEDSKCLNPDDMTQALGPSDDSLLVVKYEETAPNSEEEMYRKEGQNNMLQLKFNPETKQCTLVSKIQIVLETGKFTP